MSGDMSDCQPVVINEKAIWYVTDRESLQWYSFSADNDTAAIITGVSLNKTTATLTVGDSETLTATVTPSDTANQAVTWSSSDTDVATVANGTVTAMATGTAVITAKTSDGKYTATCTVTVNPVPTTVAVTGVTLNKESASLTVGESETLTATVSPTDATDTVVTWSSSDTSVATVADDGTVTAKAAGTATITVTTEDGGYTASCKVTVIAVSKTDGPIITVSNVTALPGKTVSVDLVLSKNTDGILGMTLNLHYPNGFVLEETKEGEALSSLTYTKPEDLSANPVSLVWDGTEVDKSEGTILTLTFIVPEGTAEGDYTIYTSYTYGEIFYETEDGDLVVQLEAGTVTVVQYMYGDVSGDGKIDTKDITLIRRKLAGYDINDNEFIAEAADVNLDGKIDTKDITLIRRYLAGYKGIVLGTQ